MKVTATANANIALVKYWGKRDSKLMLPYNGSISMTCSDLNVVTTIDFSDEYKEDSITLNDEELKGEAEYIINFIDFVRQKAGITQKAKMISKSNFPVAAGLASSSAGYAALAMAASKAVGLNLENKELTMIARMGSGSASRSIDEGFVEWYKGKSSDGSDSYAESIANKNYWSDFRLITTIVKETKKKISSRSGMAQTVSTSPLYTSEWLPTVDADLDAMRKGISERDFTTVGKVAENSCEKMHKTMETTEPPIVYRIEATRQIMNAVKSWRENGLESYFTIDAGPNVKVICLENNLDEINSRLMKLDGVIKTIICKPGDGSMLTNDHLF